MAATTVLFNSLKRTFARITVTCRLFRVDAKSILDSSITNPNVHIVESKVCVGMLQKGRGRLYDECSTRYTIAPMSANVRLMHAPSTNICSEMDADERFQEAAPIFAKILKFQNDYELPILTTYEVQNTKLHFYIQRKLRLHSIIASPGYSFTPPSFLWNHYRTSVMDKSSRHYLNISSFYIFIHNISASFYLQADSSVELGLCCIGQFS